MPSSLSIITWLPRYARTIPGVSDLICVEDACVPAYYHMLLVVAAATKTVKFGSTNVGKHCPRPVEPASSHPHQSNRTDTRLNTTHYSIVCVLLVVCAIPVQRFVLETCIQDGICTRTSCAKSVQIMVTK